AKNFVYAYSQQVNLTFEQDLGHELSLSLAYNFNGGRHLNRPINANTARGDLLVRNWQAALTDSTSNASGGLLFVGAVSAPWVLARGGHPGFSAPLVISFGPGGLNPAIAAALLQNPLAAPCVGLAQQILQGGGLSTACDPTTPAFTG